MVSCSFVIENLAISFGTDVYDEGANDKLCLYTHMFYAYTIFVYLHKFSSTDVKTSNIKNVKVHSHIKL